MDIISPDKRSALMSRIRSKNTGPEMIVRRLLHGLGYRYVLHDPRLPGKPDLVFPGKRKAIQVHGCFWHGHDCSRGFQPKTNHDFWAAKIASNKARDGKTLAALESTGWSVFIVWECTIAQKGGNDLLQRKLTEFLEG